MATELSNFKKLAEEDHLTALVPTWDAGEATSVLADPGTFVIGSSRQCDIRVALAGVAARHCSMECLDGSVYVSAIDGHPVLLNQTPVQARTQTTAGDLLSVGSATFRIEQRKASRVCRPIKPRKQREPAVAAIESALVADSVPSRNDSPAERIREIELQVAEVMAESVSPKANALMNSRESQLLDLQRRLEARNQELDSWSEQLMLQQTQLLNRQTELQKRREEIEKRHREEFAQLSAHKNSLLHTHADEAEGRRHEVEQLAAELELRQRNLREKELQLQRASERLASRDFELEELKSELDAATERQAAEYAVSLERLESAKAEQLAELESERQKIDVARSELASQQGELVDREEAISQQLADLSAAQLAFEELQRQHEAERERLTAELNAREAWHAEECAAWQAEKQELEAFAQQFQDKEAELEAAKWAFETAKQDHLGRIASARADLERREAEVSWHLESIEELRSSASQDAERIAAEREALSAAQARLQHEREQHEAELDAVRAELDALRSDLQAREAELDTAAVSVEQLSAESESLAQARAALEADQEAWRQHNADETAAVNRTRATLWELEQRLNQKSSELDHGRAEVERQRAEHAARLTELESWAAELNDRHSETANRIVQFKQLARTNAASNETSSADFEKISQELEAARSESEQLIQERGELLTALNELRAAFESVKAELLARDEQQSSAVEVAELEAAQQTIEARDQAVEELQSQLAEKAEEAARFQSELSAAEERFHAERERLESELQSAGAVVTSPVSSELEEELRGEVAALQAELADAKVFKDRSAQLDQELSEYRSQVEELSEQLREANENAAVASDRQSADDANDSEQYLQIIAELKGRLEKAQQQTETKTSAGDENTSTDEIRLLHRELDDRTVVLDKREEEIRERQRMLENSEEELEVQRRAMLESRQQLEQARAEIQVAMDSVRQAEQAGSAVVVDSPLDSHVTKTDEHDRVTGPEEDTTPKVRSEIAELFGLGEIAKDKPAQNSKDELEAVDDYSQESAAAVSLSFNEASNVLLSAPETDPDPVAEQPEDSPEDVVANYMEQLLARSREHAGTALPKELKKDEKSRPAAAAETKQQKPPGQKSFIDAYLSGQYGDVDNNDSQSQAGVSAVETAPAKPTPPPAPRVKIDLNALRNEMDSFRQLSTKSVENALATHAKRQQRGGLAARSSICLVLSMVCVFVVAAALMKVIPFGMIVWLSITAAVLSIGELAIHTMRIRKEVQEATQKVTAGAQVDRPIVESPAMLPAMQESSAETPGMMAMTAPAANTEPEMISAEDLISNDSPVGAAAHGAGIAMGTFDKTQPPAGPAASSASALGRSQIEEMLAEITGAAADEKEDDDKYYEL